jgi:hypothetical protein
LTNSYSNILISSFLAAFDKHFASKVPREEHLDSQTPADAAIEIRLSITAAEGTCQSVSYEYAAKGVLILHR